MRYFYLNNALVTLHRHAEFADYVPPVMDLFVEDPAPFGIKPLLSCPKDSEHLERTYDLLHYQHLFMKLGIPSVVHLSDLPQLLRLLGNTSSGDFWDAVNRLSGFNAQAQGQTNGDSNDYTGGENYGKYSLGVVEI